MSIRPLIGVMGSRLIGSQPFDPRNWSGISRRFFGELQQRGVLRRAFGVEVPHPKRMALMMNAFAFHRDTWRRHFYMSPGYRNALTAEIRRHILPEDVDCDFIQIGAMYDVPTLLTSQPCYSYHDGNLAQSLRAPNAPKTLDSKRVEAGLAYERHVYDGMRTIFSMSEYLRKSFIEDYGIPAHKVVTIGAGINLAELPEENPHKRYDTQEILFIGVDFARKGGWQLLEAFQRVRHRFPTTRLHLVGPPALKLPSRLNHGIEYHGFLSKTNPEHLRKLNDLFAQSSLFVMPSLYEPFGIAPLEAMAHQLPCILTKRWAFPEFVVPGETGFLVEPEQVEDLEAALLQALGDPDLLQRMGTKARRFALQNYTWPRVIDRLLHALEPSNSGGS